MRPPTASSIYHKRLREYLMKSTQSEGRLADRGGPESRDRDPLASHHSVMMSKGCDFQQFNHFVCGTTKIVTNHLSLSSFCCRPVLVQ